MPAPVRYLLACSGNHYSPRVTNRKLKPLLAVKPFVDILVISDEQEDACLLVLLGYQSPSVTKIIFDGVRNPSFTVIGGRNTSEWIKIPQTSEDDSYLVRLLSILSAVADRLG
jgi:hypothetical protein